jgi:hypothetical protein
MDTIIGSLPPVRHSPEAPAWPLAPLLPARMSSLSLQRLAPWLQQNPPWQYSRTSCLPLEPVPGVYVCGGRGGEAVGTIVRAGGGGGGNAAAALPAAADGGAGLFSLGRIGRGVASLRLTANAWGTARGHLTRWNAAQAPYGTSHANRGGAELTLVATAC